MYLLVDLPVERTTYEYERRYLAAGAVKRWSFSYACPSGLYGRRVSIWLGAFGVITTVVHTLSHGLGSRTFITGGSVLRVL
jgi:hypothetical protein